METNTEKEIEGLAEVLATLTARDRPRREVSTQFLAALVRAYLGLAEPPPHALMVAALRRVPGCMPRPLWRQRGKAEPEIRWAFVAPPKAAATASAKAAGRKPAKGKALAADISRTMKLKLA